MLGDFGGHFGGFDQLFFDSSPLRPNKPDFMSLEMDLRGNTGTKFQPSPPQHASFTTTTTGALAGGMGRSLQQRLRCRPERPVWHGRESADDANYFYFYTYPFPFVIVAVVFHVAVSLVTLLRSYDGF